MEPAHELGGVTGIPFVGQRGDADLQGLDVVGGQTELTPQLDIGLIGSLIGPPPQKIREGCLGAFDPAAIGGLPQQHQLRE